MALARTMEQVIGLCQRRADKEVDPHVDPDEWKELISEVYGRLHGAAVETGGRFFETEADITANGATQYALPDAHHSTIGVDRVLNAAGARVELDELMVQERNVFSARTGPAAMWSFTGTNIRLYPAPASGTYKHLYVPQPTDYTSVGLSESIDFINNDGLSFIVWGVASIALHKGDANQMRAIDESERALARFFEWGVRRALNLPKRRMVRETDLSVDVRARWGIL